MRLGFGYLCKFVVCLFLFLFFFQKAENDKLKKSQWAKNL